MMALERSYSNEDEAELARSNFSARAKYGNQDLGVSQQGLDQTTSFFCLGNSLFIAHVPTTHHTFSG